jgi:hypothetical protein
MTDRGRTAVGARVLALGASAAATLALMAGMAAAPDTAVGDPPGTSGTVDPLRPAAPPQLHPTTAPPTTSSHAS